MFDSVLSIPLLIFKGNWLIFSQILKSFNFLNANTETSLQSNTYDFLNLPLLKYIVRKQLNTLINRKIEIGKRKNQTEKENYIEELCELCLAAQTITLTKTSACRASTDIVNVTVKLRLTMNMVRFSLLLLLYFLLAFM